MKVVVYVRGGIVTCVKTSEEVESVQVVDYDCEEEDDLQMFPNPEGVLELCYVYEGDVHIVGD